MRARAESKALLPGLIPSLRTIMNRLLIVLVLLAAFPLPGSAQVDPLSASFVPSIDTKAADYPANIWVTDTMQKIVQANSTAGPNHWGTFYCTQGEFCDFQVHVVAPIGGYSALAVAASAFTQTAPASFTIPAPDATHNNIEVYREAYITITTKSSSANAYYNATGSYPDALIPTIDPYYHQTTNAFPVAVAANNTQSGWIDVFIPTNAPSGYYLGSITVSNSGTTLATLPIIIAVWQWPASQGGRMPGTSTLPSFIQYGWHDFCGNVGGSCNDNNADTDGGVLFMDHRWTMTDPINANGTQQALLFGGNTTGITGAKPIIPGATTTGLNWRNQTGYWSEQGFVTEFGSITYPRGSTGTYPNITPFLQTADEPGNNASTWASMCTAKTAANAVKPPLATETTSDLTNMNNNGGSNCIDILTVNVGILEPNGNNGPAGLTRSTYNSWLAHTNPDGIKPMLWSYISCYSTPCGPGFGNPYNYANYVIDARPASNRVMEWMTYFHQQTGELYYYSSCAWTSNGWNNGCGVAVGNDPWNNQYFSGNNGDGTLAYPSNAGATQHVTQPGGAALTTPIWIPSIRLKHMRDGMQDWEYMNLLNQVGLGASVTTQITSWITNSYTYEYTGTGLMAARQALGQAIHQLTYSGSARPPAPFVSITVQ
jgi:hypothetical protein